MRADLSRAESEMMADRFSDAAATQLFLLSFMAILHWWRKSSHRNMRAIQKKLIEVEHPSLICLIFVLLMFGLVRTYCSQNGCQNIGTTTAPSPTLFGLRAGLVTFFTRISLLSEVRQDQGLEPILSAEKVWFELFDEIIIQRQVIWLAWLSCSVIFPDGDQNPSFSNWKGSSLFFRPASPFQRFGQGYLFKKNCPCDWIWWSQPKLKGI